MSLEVKIQPSDVVRTGAKITAAGLAYGLPGVMGVTALHHREETHRSVKLHPFVKKVINWLMRTYSTDSSDWSSVHRGHHYIPDATLKPQHDITLAIEWAEANPEQAQGVTIPDSYPHLDRFVRYFPKEDVLTIGQYAKEIMRDRLGGAYKPPDSYSEEDLQRILNPTEPRYLYSKAPKKHDAEYSQDEIAEVLLGDPHSPARMRERNGVLGVLKGNVGLYRRASHLFQRHPELKPKDLQTGKKVDHQKVRIRGFVEGSLVAAGGVLLYRNKYEPKDFLKAILAGTLINTVALGFHIFGGNVTNSLGHAGVMTPGGFLRAIGAKEYKLTLNPDGTVSTGADNGGPLKKITNVLTLDEVSGQDEHHKGPDKIAFTSKKGLAAWIDAPWGMVLSTLARNEYFPLISPGPGFDLKEGETRPDMPSPAVETIQRLRVEQLKALCGS